MSRRWVSRGWCFRPTRAVASPWGLAGGSEHLTVTGYWLDAGMSSAHPTHLSPKGHSKSIQCLTVHKNGGKSYIYSGSHDGHINIL